LAALAVGLPLRAAPLGLADGLDVDDEPHPVNAIAAIAIAASGLEKRM